MSSFRVTDAIRRLFDGSSPAAGDDGKAIVYTHATGSLDFSTIATQEELDVVVKGGRLYTASHAAPADGALAAGDLVLWFDQTDGAGKLMVKAKTANGTVATGAVTLT